MAISIGSFSRFFGDLYNLYIDKQNLSLVKVIKWIAKTLTFIGRVVFEIVLIWTGVNAVERKI